MVNRNPLLALLLLLVIALGVYFWCRKKICKKTSQPTNSTSVNDDNQMNPSGPPTVCIPPAGTTVVTHQHQAPQNLSCFDFDVCYP